MQNTQYRAPTSIGEAVALLRADGDARVLAGGTDLLVQVRGGRPEPTTWVDVKRIPDLRSIEVSDAGLRLGAAVPAAEICENEEIAWRWPGVAEATDLIGSTQIQGRATLGGNLCNGSPAADSVPALIAAGAECAIVGPEGERVVPVESFVTGPGETLLRPGELLVEIRIANPPARSADAYLRLIPRSEMDIAVAGAAVALTLDSEGRCSRARVAIGAVAPTALLLPDAAAALTGSTLDEASLQRAGEVASEAASPIDDMRGSADYRRRVVAVLVRRATASAARRAQERS